MRENGKVSGILRILSIVGAVAVGFVIGRETAPKPENFIGWYKVEGVIDGDTIKISGQSIRYIGVDTPETKHPQKPVECFGPEAAAKNKERRLTAPLMLKHSNSQLGLTALTCLLY